MPIKFSNNGKTLIASAVSSSATTINVDDASVFPSISGSEYFYVTLEDTSGNVEIVKVTGVSTNTLTVSRAQESTTARSFSDGDKAENRLTAGGLNDVSTQADTDTNTTYTAGSGLTLTGTEFANSAPDQTVALTGSGGTTVSGTYPNFTISSSASIDGTTINPAAVQIGGTTVIDSSRNLTNLGTIQVDVTSSNGARVTGTDSSADAAFTTMLIDHNASGSTALTGDRSHIGLQIDMDSSATGGDTSNEHRLYGIHNNVRATGDSDVIYGVYSIAEAQQTSETVSSLYGGFFEARGDVTAGTLSNSYGVYGYNSVANASGSTISNNYALYGKTLLGATQDSNVNQAVAVYGEVEIDTSGASTTLTTARAFDAQIDNDSDGDVTIDNGYLFYGNYAGTLPTNAYGVYINDAVRNRFNGTIQTGDGSLTQVSYGFNADENTGMYSPANHEVAFAVNGTQRLKVNASGAQVTGSVTATGSITATAALVGASVSIGGTTVIDSSREGSFATRAEFGGVDSVGNVTPASNSSIVSGYGIIGNRATMYVTNGGGAVQLGNGSGHNGNPGLTVGTGSADLGSGRALAMNGTTVIDSSRNLVNINSVEIGDKVTLAESTDRADVLQITGTTSSWAGLQIRNSSGEGRWSFMTDGAMAGIYDDENGDWYMQFNELGATEIFHNSSQKLTTSTTGVSITGDVTTASVYLNDTSTRIEEGSGNAVRVQTSSGYVDIGSQNTSWAHINTDRPAFYFSKGLTVNTGVFSSYDEDAILRRAGSTTNQITISTTGVNIAGSLSLVTSATDARYLHLPRGGGITLYGDASTHHGIFSRGPANSATDDILISSYGAVYFDLDSNANNTSGANFEITKHNGTAAIFKVDGETSDVTTLGNIYMPSYLYHSGDTNSYIRFVAADDMQLVAGGRQMIRMDEGTNPDRLYFPNSSSYTDSNGTAVFAGNVTAYASDRRLKTNITPIENALAKVMAIRGVTYDWIDEVEDLGFTPDRQHDCMGVIAQELEEAGVDQVIMPAPFDRIRTEETNWEDVSKSGEEYKTVDYDKLTALLIEAVKEQQGTIKSLQQRIEQLEELV